MTKAKTWLFVLTLVAVGGLVFTTKIVDTVQGLFSNITFTWQWTREKPQQIVYGIRPHLTTLTGDQIIATSVTGPLFTLRVHLPKEKGHTYVMQGTQHDVSALLNMSIVDTETGQARLANNAGGSTLLQCSLTV